MWQSSLFWAIVGLAGGVITSLIFYLIGKKNKKLTYSIITTQLVSNRLTQIDGLNVFFRNQIINDLNTTEIIFRNTGTEIIELNDFAKLDKLRILTSGMFLPFEDVNNFVSESDKLSDFRLCSIDASTINIDFDYIPCNSSYRLNLLHSGKIEIFGTLKNGQLYESGKKSTASNSRYIAIIILLFILYLADGVLNFFHFDLLSLKPIYSALLSFCLVNYFVILLKKLPRINSIIHNYGSGNVVSNCDSKGIEITQDINKA